MVPVEYPGIEETLRHIIMLKSSENIIESAAYAEWSYCEAPLFHFVHFFHLVLTSRADFVYTVFTTYFNRNNWVSHITRRPCRPCNNPVWYAKKLTSWESVARNLNRFSIWSVRCNDDLTLEKLDSLWSFLKEIHYSLKMHISMALQA